MSEPWYDMAPAGERITQGDLILRCPILNWAGGRLPDIGAAEGAETLRQFVTTFEADVVVMTQACDLEHDKVSNVVLCPHLPLSQYRALWESKMREAGQNPSEKAWRRACDDIANGYVWQQALLNRWSASGAETDLRVVDFHEIYTLPRAFLEGLLAQRGQPRPRLRPPYREHLSQAFARFFMRVGLPAPLDKTW